MLTGSKQSVAALTQKTTVYLVRAELLSLCLRAEERPRLDQSILVINRRVTEHYADREYRRKTI